MVITKMKIKNNPKDQIYLKKWNEEDRKEYLLNVFTPRIFQGLEHYNPEINNKTEQKDLANVITGKGLYVYGPIGSGKTLYVAHLLEQIIRERYLITKNAYNILDLYTFINAPSMLQRIKESYMDKNGTTEQELISSYSNVDILVVDDIGAQKISEWVLETFYLILNYRYEYLKTTIYTSNFSLQQLAEKLDDRIPSRIQESCTIRKFTNTDLRLK
jgi:DNA replication protein DnaC